MVSLKQGRHISHLSWVRRRGGQRAAGTDASLTSHSKIAAEHPFDARSNCHGTATPPHTVGISRNSHSTHGRTVTAQPRRRARSVFRGTAIRRTVKLSRHSHAAAHGRNSAEHPFGARLVFSRNIRAAHSHNPRSTRPPFPAPFHKTESCPVTGERNEHI